MKNRCYNPNVRSFPRYGARGIQVCERWRVSFENFLADMGERPNAQHTLERRDTNGHYEPENCYWATQAVQQSNRRDNHRITFNGETRTVSQWTRHLGFPIGTISQRIKKLGWDAARALTTPIQFQRP